MTQCVFYEVQIQQQQTIFVEKHSEFFFKKMLPVTQKATNSTGLRSAYKKMVSKLGFMRQWLKLKDKLDLDSYITKDAIEGLFILIAEEEQAIRRDPVKRTSRLLRKFFSTIR